MEGHRLLGPEWLESAYEQRLARDMEVQGTLFQWPVPLPVEYQGVRLACGSRVDLLVRPQLILEPKAVEKIKSSSSTAIASQVETMVFEVR